MSTEAAALASSSPSVCQLTPWGPQNMRQEASPSLISADGGHGLLAELALALHLVSRQSEKQLGHMSEAVELPGSSWPRRAWPTPALDLLKGTASIFS